MRVPHIYQPSVITLDNPVTLDEDAAGHIGRVLRMKVGEQVSIFNGEGGEYLSEIIEVSKKNVVVQPLEFIDHDVESPLKIHLGQGVSRGDKMDFTIQKSVELGIAEVIPLHTERSVVRLDGERAAKKLTHWESILVAASEQSGRTVLPQLQVVQNLPLWLSSLNPHDNALRLMLTPRSDQTILSVLKRCTPQALTLLIGPEGGLSDAEEEQAKRAGFVPVTMGQRILRTETAGIVALATIHTVWNQF